MNNTELRTPLRAWLVLLAVLAEHDAEHGPRLNTSRIGERGYALTHGHASLPNVGQVKRTLEDLEGAQLVERSETTTDGGYRTVQWSLTDSGRARYRELADVLARLAAITPRKSPARKPPKGSPA
ncbi:MAG TPA: hypothetical protein VGO62_09720 [Myxococcota bacterium]|jgi:DNA-binding PadR family transcriptional regulator